MSTVLVLGGSGFMGSHAIEQLAPVAKRIMTVNRGSQWNSLWGAGKLVQPLIAHNFACDRSAAGLMKCQELLDYNFDDGSVRMIVDFSSYRAGHMRDSLDFVRRKFASYHHKPIYVYISSDSVYEVCRRVGNEDTSDWRLLVETDSVRPDSEQERKKLADLDDYAEGKLAAEEVLVAEHGDFPYIALRLPDVLGPRDQCEGGRWWRYQTWARLAACCQNKAVASLHVPNWLLKRPLSFVYAPDVARFVRLVYEKYDEQCSLLAPVEPSQSFIPVNNVYNFAWQQPITLPKLLNLMCDLLKIPPPVSYECESDTSTVRPISFLPSVTRGPIDVSKVMSHFSDFKFTPFDESIKATVDFFEQVSYQQCHREQFLKMLRKLLAEFQEHGIVSGHDAFWSSVLTQYGCQNK